MPEGLEGLGQAGWQNFSEKKGWIVVNFLEVACESAKRV